MQLHTSANASSSITLTSSSTVIKCFGKFNPGEAPVLPDDFKPSATKSEIKSSGPQQFAQFPHGALPDDGQKHTIWYGVSIGNIKQNTDSFGAFVDLINRMKDRIGNIQIVISGHLYRHYELDHGEQQKKGIENYDKWAKNFARKANLNWIAENIQHLKRLNVPYEIIDWETLVHVDSHSKRLEQIYDLYKTDPQFQEYVKKTIGNLSKHITGTYEQKLRFLFEEIAVFMDVLQNVFFTYPSPKFTDASDYVLKKFNCGPRYLPLTITSKEAKEKTKAANTEARSSKSNNIQSDPFMSAVEHCYVQMKPLVPTLSRMNPDQQRLVLASATEMVIRFGIFNQNNSATTAASLPPSPLSPTSPNVSLTSTASVYL